MTSELTSKTSEELMYELKIKRFIKELKLEIKNKQKTTSCMSTENDMLNWIRFNLIDKKALEVFGKEIVE